jgi:ABC-type amino acid transport substrate-binding protein
MKKYLSLAALALLTGLMIAPVTLAQDAVPTLIPPTPVPVVDTGEGDVLLAESTVARIQRDGRVRVGVFYNEPPFGEMTIRGDISGYDADLARLIAETWGVEVDFVQVTHQNGISLLKRGQIDMLIAAQVHRRDLDNLVEFSMTYHIGKQAMLVRADSGIETLINLSGRKVGFVIGTDGERAISEYIATSGLPMQAQAYLTLDMAYAALFGGEVDGIVAREEHLLRVAASQLDAIKIIAEPVALEPFALALPRQDLQFRNLINQTLQFLAVQDVNGSSKLSDLTEKYFPGKPFAIDALPIYNGLPAEAPKPASFGTDVPLPQQYIVPRLNTDKTLRVAGITDVPADAPEWQKRLDTYQRGLVERMAAKWGATVQYIPGDPLQLVETGQADLALGVRLDWGVVNRVDFTLPYMLHGDRLMVKKKSGILGFASPEIRGRWVAVMDTDGNAQERAENWIEALSGFVNFYNAPEGAVARVILEEQNADVAYADHLKLLRYLEEYTENFELTERWYTRNYLAFAVPRNDIDFRLLVDYTLQEIIKSGDLKTLMQPLLPPGMEPLTLDVWAGSRPIGSLLAG